MVSTARPGHAFGPRRPELEDVLVQENERAERLVMSRCTRAALGSVLKEGREFGAR
jgi:hypothetical protein